MRLLMILCCSLVMLVLLSPEVVECKGTCSCFKRISQGVRILKDDCEVSLKQ